MQNDEPKINPVGNVGIVNLEQKKKPHNVNIRNHNPHEPKIKANTKYSAKQSFRKYKTNKEPNLLNKIQVNEDDDIVNKIKEAFGIKPNNTEGYTVGNPNTNFSEEITAPSAYNNGVDEPPLIESKMYNSNRLAQQGQRREQGQVEALAADFDDISPETKEELLLQASSSSDMAIDDDPSRGLLYQFWNDSEREEKVVSDKEQDAIKKIQYNYQKHLSKKEGRAVKKDLDGAMALVKIGREFKTEFTATPIKNRNKVVGLDIDLNATPQKSERYSLGLDVALPTPKEFQFKKPEKKDAETTMRGAGRPLTASYRPVTNPSRVSVGEMTNPTAF